MKIPQINIKKTLEISVVLLIIGIAAYIRLANITNNPGWYSDEGTLIDIANNYNNGKIQYLAVNDSTLLFARMPLFPFLLSLIFRFTGEGITPLRMFSGSLGVASVATLYFLVRKSLGQQGIGLSLLSAFILAIYPKAVIYSRVGFSYNLLAPLTLLYLLGIWEYIHTDHLKWLFLSMLSIGLGTISDVLAFSFLPLLLILLVVKKWKLFLIALLGSLIPFVFYSAIMIMLHPNAYLFDLNFILTRIGNTPFIAQLPFALLNIGNLYFVDPWILISIIGLFMLTPKRWRQIIILIFFLFSLSLLRTTNVVGLGFYYLIPIFPIVGIGLASVIFYGVPIIMKTIEDAVNFVFSNLGWSHIKIKKWEVKKALVVLANVAALLSIVIPPLGFLTGLTVYQAQNKFNTSFDAIIDNPQDAIAVANFVNHHISPNDLIISSPTLAWMYHARTADFQMAIAINRIATAHLPGNIPANRFNYDTRYQVAKYIVIDNVWNNWAVKEMPQVEEMIEKISKWPIVYQSGNISVFENPSLF